MTANYLVCNIEVRVALYGFLQQTIILHYQRLYFIVVLSCLEADSENVVC